MEYIIPGMVLSHFSRNATYLAPTVVSARGKEEKKAGENATICATQYSLALIAGQPLCYIH